jgi:hypothetical protein
MSDQNQPKPPPAESPTRAFVLKMDNWMTDLLKSDLEADLNAPAEPPAAEEAKPPPAKGTDRGE